jgi:hypothetical protein
MRLATSALIPSQVPEFVRSDYPTFVAFVEAYYEYLDSQGVDLLTVVDLDKTLDNFIVYFKNELASALPNDITVDERFVLQHIKDQYLAKGSEGSFKLLFRLLYNKIVTVDYPGRQMLRASDGRWNQDISIFVRVDVGTPDLIDGKLVDIVQPNRRFKVLVDRRQYVEVEVDRVVQVSNSVYEIFIDRKFFGNIKVGDYIKYREIFSAQILATTSTLVVKHAGTGFKLGQLFELKNAGGIRSIIKVTRTDADGGILSCEFIKYGVGYGTDFDIDVNPQRDYNSPTTGETSSAVIVPSGIPNQFNVQAADRMNGFSEQGYINFDDYARTTSYTVSPTNVSSSGTDFIATINLDAKVSKCISVVDGGSGYELGDTVVIYGSDIYGMSSDNDITLTVTGLAEGMVGIITEVTASGSLPLTNYSDGTYSGKILREFSAQPLGGITLTNLNKPATIIIKLGALAKYPGYYSSNDGFLDDAIFIQDSRYYQAFSYVLRIDERLSKYRTAVRTMVHPAGTALFGEFLIQNNFDISVSLESLIKILAVSVSDSISMLDGHDVPNGLIKDVFKAVNDSIAPTEFHTFFMEKPLNDSIDTPQDEINFFVGKSLTDSLDTPEDSTTFSMNKVLEDSQSFSETITRDVYKVLEDSHTLSDLVALTTAKYLTDTETMSEDDDGYVAMNPYSEGGYFSIHPIIYDNTVESKFGSTVDTNAYT